MQSVHFCLSICTFWIDLSVQLKSIHKILLDSSGAVLEDGDVLAGCGGANYFHLGRAKNTILVKRANIEAFGCKFFVAHLQAALNAFRIRIADRGMATRILVEKDVIVSGTLSRNWRVIRDDGNFAEESAVCIAVEDVGKQVFAFVGIEIHNLPIFDFEARVDYYASFCWHGLFADDCAINSSFFRHAKDLFGRHIGAEFKASRASVYSSRHPFVLLRKLESAVGSILRSKVQPLEVIFV